MYKIIFYLRILSSTLTQNENTFAFLLAAPEQVAEPLLERDDAKRLLRVERGETLFGRHACAPCHAVWASRPAAVPFVNLRGLHSNEEIVARPRVPPASRPRLRLTPEERGALAVFVPNPAGDARLASRDRFRPDPSRQRGKSGGS